MGFQHSISAGRILHTATALSCSTVAIMVIILPSIMMSNTWELHSIIHHCSAEDITLRGPSGAFHTDRYHRAFCGDEK